jgi:hypothetical protein
LTLGKTWINVLLLLLVGLSIYFIFFGKELVGIGLLILAALLEYWLVKIKKTV